MAFYFSPPVVFTPSQPLPEDPITKRLKKLGVILDDTPSNILPLIPTDHLV